MADGWSKVADSSRRLALGIVSGWYLWVGAFFLGPKDFWEGVLQPVLGTTRVQLTMASPFWFYFVLVVGMFVAALKTFHSLRMERDELARKVVGNSPQLVGFVDVVSINEISATECRMVVFLNVTNAGTPSIAQHYRIVLSVDGVQVPVQKLRPQPSETIEVVDGNETIQIGAEELISFKTHPKPIPHGGGERGVLVCHIPISLPEHWTFVVELTDVTGKTVQTPVFQPSLQTKTTNIRELLGWPGLKVGLIDGATASPRSIETVITMKDWQKLSAAFKDLQTYGVRADWQKSDVAGEQWSIRGGPQECRDIEVLCRQGGAMLLKSPNVRQHLSPTVVAHSNHVWRWLEYVKEQSGGLDDLDHMVGTNNGVPVETHYFGRISDLKAKCMRVSRDCSTTEM